MHATPRQEQQPAHEEVTEVAPGIRRMQLDVKIPGLGHVNCYAMEDDRGFAIMDPGMPGDEYYDVLLAALKRADIPMHRIHTVIITHAHPDHFGGAMRVHADSGADIVTHELFRTFFDPEDGADSDPEQLADDGFEDALKNSAFGKKVPWGGGNYEPLNNTDRDEMMLRMRDPLFRPRPTVRLVDADHIMLAGRRFVALHTPGHTADHLCLFDPESGVLFTGDHVLPTITPHISGMHYGDDPLAAYFESLRRVQVLAGVTVALPAHGDPFNNVSARVTDIIQHHNERLETLVIASKEMGRPATVAEMMQRLFRERSWGTMAESETYAHLEHLRILGRADRTWDEEFALYDLSVSGRSAP